MIFLILSSSETVMERTDNQMRKNLTIPLSDKIVRFFKYKGAKEGASPALLQPDLDPAVFLFALLRCIGGDGHLLTAAEDVADGDTARP